MSAALHFLILLGDLSMQRVNPSVPLEYETLTNAQHNFLFDQAI